MIQTTIGQHATLCVGSDRYPYEVIGMTASGKTLTLRNMKAVHVSGSFQGQNAVYNAVQDPMGMVIKARWSNRANAFKYEHKFVHIGEAQFYQDPNF